MRLKCISVLLFLIVFLFGCERAGYMEKYLSATDENIIKLSSVYSDEQLSDIVQMANISNVRKKYSIECVRKVDDLYRVSFLGNGKVAVLYFSSNGDKLSSKIYNLDLCLDDFQKLEKGDSLSKVQRIDENGEYLFLYTGRNSPKESTHFTSDGYIVVITYDDKNQITKVNVCLI